MLAIDTDFCICSSMVICLLNFLNPSMNGLLLSFVFTFFKALPCLISLSNSLWAFCFSLSYRNLPSVNLVFGSNGWDLSLHWTCFNFLPPSISFRRPVQSGLVLGLDLKASKARVWVSFRSFLGKGNGIAGAGGGIGGAFGGWSFFMLSWRTRSFLFDGIAWKRTK